MSEERAVEITVGTPVPKPFRDLNRVEKKARLANILDRGFVHDRLVVELPAGLYGEWVVDDSSEITRMQSMGFDIDTTYAHKRALHGDGAGKSKVGDVIFMTAPMEVKEIIDELRYQKFVDLNGKPNQTNRTQREETEFKENAALPTINEGSASGVNAEEIKSAIFTQ